MRYGYWLPVFGGWLRNVEDEGMEASWEYVSRLARRSEEIGYDLTLIAELNLNDIKGIQAPSLDAWSTAAALAAVTRRLELMVAVRPTFLALMVRESEASRSLRKYPLMSRMTSVGCDEKMSIEPFAPTGTMTAFATVVPLLVQLITDASGIGSPVGQTVR